MIEIELFSPYLALSPKERLSTKKILSEIREYFAGNILCEDPIWIPISEYPGKRIEFALELYMIKCAAWKGFRILDAGDGIFAILSATKRNPLK